ncbi:MAG: ABC transporter ATP-binding protein [SAR324 cluster bacterium]|nr:ABC transporter ATP-binding protein [SAR324 cluster bacterium]MBL7034491.1 ABC transporter ATP-binding protein [SAR324 cluster bacterium]
MDVSKNQSDSEVVLRLRGITKVFGSLVANDDISLELKSGEVLALLGENGAGKTTLMNILFGHYVADSGSVEVFGKNIPEGSPHAAIEAGIGMVHQHFTLADNLSVLDNVMLGTESLWSLSSNRRSGRRHLEELGKRFGLEVQPHVRISELSIGERQRVEILKALYRKARILILDEPTAVLTPQETKDFFETLKKLVKGGLSLIFISHKMQEVLAISDRVAVLRDGSLVTEIKTAAASETELAHAMVGREIELPERKALEAGRSIFKLEDVTVSAGEGRPGLKEVSLNICAKEIVGIAGVSGNGQTALADLISGLAVPQSGIVELHGEIVRRFTPENMLRNKVGRIPEDRHTQGVIGDMSLAENSISECYREAQFSTFGWQNHRNRDRFAENVVSRFDVRGYNSKAPVRLLSGGNMQKLILGRVLSGNPQLILANQPGRGLDVGAVAYVHQQLLSARAEGAAILLISEDLEELLQIADRIAVIHRGQLSETFPRESISIAQLGLLMTGQQNFSTTNYPSAGNNAS